MKTISLKSLAVAYHGSSYWGKNMNKICKVLHNLAHYVTMTFCVKQCSVYFSTAL